MILKLRATEWFQLSKRLLINACKNILHFQKPAVAYSNKKKCVRLLRPCRDAKHFSTSKPVFTNMSVGVDLSVRKL